LGEKLLLLLVKALFAALVATRTARDPIRLLLTLQLLMTSRTRRSLARFVCGVVDLELLLVASPRIPLLLSSH